MTRSLVFLSLLLSLPAFAQTETPAAPQFGEEIEVRVIDVDVVVTDRQGNPLTDLTREQFEIYEDGKRIDVDYFSRIVGGRIADLPAPAPAPATPDAIASRLRPRRLRDAADVGGLHRPDQPPAGGAATRACASCSSSCRTPSPAATAA